MTTAEPLPARVHEVSRFESSLLSLLRFFLGRLPTDQGLHLLRSSIPAPGCLSATAVRLVQDSLAKGCVLFLTRSGGWRRDRYLRDGEASPGRVWERIPLPERTLTFSPVVLEFLMWATAEKLPGPKVSWNPKPGSLTAGDDLFFFLAFDACRADPPMLEALRYRGVFASNPYIWLTGPADVADHDEPRPPAFERCFQGSHVAILESLQPLLTQRWLHSERLKARISDWKRMRYQGHAEAIGLGAFLDAANRANRRDLARFLLQVNATLFSQDRAPTFWTGGLAAQGPPRLADRLDTQRAALAVPRQMAVLAGWLEQSRSVGYFDEGYAASQAWKADWEAIDGDTIAGRARAAVEALEPLRAVAPEAPEGERP